ncbi:MAG TPA: hypothetical protein VFV31_06895 [Chitinophagaceae bacterium]|nr:hypothetical protein [Chitinophagaceae bacterium]
MKKIMLTLAIAVTTLSAFAFGSVSDKVLKSFREDFNTAKEVVWTSGSNYYKAAFTYNDRHVFAYYSTEGELLGVTRYLSTADLPMHLQTHIKKDYANYWVTDLFEVSKADGTAYFVTLENADTKLVLRSANGTDWSQYQKVKKS